MVLSRNDCWLEITSICFFNEVGNSNLKSFYIDRWPFGTPRWKFPGMTRSKFKVHEIFSSFRLFKEAFLN